MKGHNLFLALSTILLFISFSAAWPWPELQGGKSEGLILPRQQTASQTSSKSDSASTKTSAAESSNTDESAATTGSDSASASATASGSGAATTGDVSSSKRVSSAFTNATRTTTSPIDPRSPPGGVQMLTPAPIEGTTYLKVGDQITFKWNYTSLLVSPKYIDVVATNTVNSQTYTIAGNQSFDPTQTVTWDTGHFDQTSSLPFVVATYTLMIYDADSNPTAVASAGYLGSFSNLQFGMYTPQPYVPLNEFRCATCSGAMSVHEKQALGVLFGTCIVTVLSFTWFVTGTGVL